jgi:AcrR family transcriptional regulator
MTAAEKHPVSQSELGAQTRDRLVEAAERLFAQGGFAMTSVRDITAAAGCNVAAVNYHFGSKLNLYQEVFRRRLAAMRQQRVASIRDTMARTGNPATLEQLIEAFAGAFLASLMDQRRGHHLIELISRELLDPKLPHELFLSEVVEPVHGELARAMMAAAPGLRPGAARVCVISIVGQLLQVAQRLRRAERSAGWEAELPPVPAIVDQIARFSAAGVRACAEVPE